jgi:hypothetical protein
MLDESVRQIWFRHMLHAEHSDLASDVAAAQLTAAAAICNAVVLGWPAAEARELVPHRNVAGIVRRFERVLLMALADHAPKAMSEESKARLKALEGGER